MAENNGTTPAGEAMMESIEQVRKRVTKEVFIELGIYRHADSMTALVGFDAKVIGKLIESRLLLEPGPCGVDGHLRKHWVHFTHCAHPTYIDTQIGPSYILRTCATCGSGIPQVNGEKTNPMYEGTPGYGKHDYCTLCKSEKAARLDERKLAAFHEFREGCTCFHCRRIAELEAK